MTTLSTLQIGMEWFTEHPGGLNRVYANLVGELAAQGVATSGLVAGTPAVTTLSGGLVQSFAEVDAPLVRRLQGVRQAAAPYLRAAGDRLVAAHFALNTIPLLDGLGTRPLVVHFQGPWGQESRLEGDASAAVVLKTWIERMVYARANRVIVLSSAFADLLHHDFGIARERIHVVPAGTEIDRFADAPLREESRAALGWPLDRPIVLCVRRLVRRVGLDQLIDAAAELREMVPRVLVLVAGQGAMREELAVRITARGLGHTVRLLGFVPDAQLPLAYRGADLSVVPSIALEGFGLVTAESLAAGTPVIVTPVGGLAGVVSPLASELVTPSASPHDIAVTIGRVLLGELRQPDAAACAAYAAANFTWPVMTRRVRDVYELARDR